MKQTTLLFLLTDTHILLAMKKRGFGAGRWNGVGGKIEPNETVQQAASRECQEEIGVTPNNLHKVAHLTFRLPTQSLITHTFVTTDWHGQPSESAEMAPQWFAKSDIPYDTMWDDDRHWLPHILAGQHAVCEFDLDHNDKMTNKRITLVQPDHHLLTL